MSEDSQDPSDKITTNPSPNDSVLDSEMPEVGIGLIVLGGICLLFGIAIGLIFTAK
tara:strand:- start:418 stop:585 length:168 start_codon:yes stop_codon:yes gene_type:complete